MTGNYTQTATGEVIGYWDSAGILNVNGNATLSGYLYLHYDFKNPPQKGATYTAMTFGSRSGEFTSVNTGISVKYNTNSAVAKFH